MHFYPKIDIYFSPEPRSSTFNMEKQSYENSRDITLGITTLGAKYFSPEASCRSHILETIPWKQFQYYAKHDSNGNTIPKRYGSFRQHQDFENSGRNQMSQSQWLLSLHMFRNRY